jgi:hypothetical protein
MPHACRCRRCRHGATLRRSPPLSPLAIQTSRRAGGDVRPGAYTHRPSRRERQGEQARIASVQARGATKQKLRPAELYRFVEQRNVRLAWIVPRNPITSGSRKKSLYAIATTTSSRTSTSTSDDPAAPGVGISATFATGREGLKIMRSDARAGRFRMYRSNQCRNQRSLASSATINANASRGVTTRSTKPVVWERTADVPDRSLAQRPIQIASCKLPRVLPRGRRDGHHAFAASSGEIAKIRMATAGIKQAARRRPVVIGYAVL